MHPNVKKGAKGVYSRRPATQLGIRMGDPFWRSSEVTTCSKLICFSDWDNLLALILFFFFNTLSPWPEAYQTGWAGKPPSPSNP